MKKIEESLVKKLKRDLKNKLVEVKELRKRIKLETYVEKNKLKCKQFFNKSIVDLSTLLEGFGFSVYVYTKKDKKDCSCFEGSCGECRYGDGS